MTFKPIIQSPVSDNRRPAVAATRSITRRRGAAIAAATLALVILAGCDSGGKWHAIDISGSSPPLALAMTRASDGKEVSEADYRGRIVLLFFGYTFCPDECPTTLSNIALVLTRLGKSAARVRVLFVTVDPNRDTLPVLAAYVKNFAPEIEGLHGSADQLAVLARRYRVIYSVRPATADHPYEVTHGSVVYVFDGSGAARLLIPSLDKTHPDIVGTVADLRRLIFDTKPPGLLTRVLRLA